MSTGKTKAQKHLINENIPYKNILLIYEDNTSKEMSIDDAILLAKEKKMDLILINSSAPVPVVKIMDYGRFLYEQKRKNKGSKKNNVQIKTVTLKPKIDLHDLQWKSNQANEWLKDGDRVLLIIKAYGRMAMQVDLINLVFEKFCSLVVENGLPKSELKQISKIQFETYFFPHKK